MYKHRALAMWVTVCTLGCTWNIYEKSTVIICKYIVINTVPKLLQCSYSILILFCGMSIICVNRMIGKASKRGVNLKTTIRSVCIIKEAGSSTKLSIRSTLNFEK